MTRTHSTTARRPTALPPSRLDGLRPYQPPAADPRVDLLLDSNEGPAPDERIVSRMRAISPEDLRRYPDAAPLERQIAAQLAVSPDRVVVTNGGDDAIDRVCRAMLGPGRRFVTHAPSFEMIPRSARLAGADVETFTWMDGAFPLVSCLASMRGASLVALVSPNNPTGLVVSREHILEVARTAGRRGAVVMVDLAYVEFADDDPTRLLIEEPNVVVVRTFSKAMGLAGLRVGFAVASPEVAGWLRVVGGPYPVSSVSLALAGAALDPAEARRGYVDRVRSERRVLARTLRELGCDTPNSQANFLLPRLADASRVHGSLLEGGISVRRFDTRPALGDRLRVTLPGDERAFERLQGALHKAISGSDRVPAESDPVGRTNDG